MFTQTTPERIVAGTDGRTIARICYHSCGKLNHYADYCPAKASGMTLMHIEYTLAQRLGTCGICCNWLLLDSCSTISREFNPTIVQDIRPCVPNKSMHVVTNVGSKTYFKREMLRILP